MLDKQFYVYVHMKATDDSVFYVGKGSKYRSTSKNGRSEHWHRIVNKHGLIVEIVKNNLSFEESNSYEIYLIAKLRNEGCNLCNLTDGGEGSSGYVVTEKTKLAISKATKGKKRTEETKAKMKGNKNAFGAKRSAETRAKMSASKKGTNNIIGRPVSEETRKKISETRKKTWAAKQQLKLLESAQLTEGVFHA
jgi:NUMOD3 motif